MATVSFSKQFSIKNPIVTDKILEAFNNPKITPVREVDLKSENQKGIELLRLTLQQSNSKK